MSEEKRPKNQKCPYIRSQNDCKATKTLPGSSGWIWSDQTLSVYLDATGYLDREVTKHKSRVFISRLFLKPCIIIAENQALYELLTVKDHLFDTGMDEFYDLFGDNLLFMNDPEASLTRRLLYPLFNEECKSNYKAITRDTLSEWMSELDPSQPFNVYESIKLFALRLNLRLYIGLDHNKEPLLFQKFSSIARTHWHGFCSVPVNIHVSGFRSGFGKAIDAKGELIQLLQQRLRDKFDHAFLTNISETLCNEEILLSHLLLFCCNVIPKVFSSVLTSFILEAPTWRPYYQSCSSEEEKDAALDRIMLEVLRLVPPLAGGRRIALHDTQLNGYAIPKGQVIHFVLFGANTDPEVFPQPEVFRPQRWSEENKNDRDRMLSFGGGRRECICKDMVWDIILMFSKTFIETFDWEIPENISKVLKYVPVARPKQKPIIQLYPKEI